MSFCERFPTEIDQAIIDSILNNDGPTALKDLHALTLTSQAFHHTFNECLYKFDGPIAKKKEKTTYFLPVSQYRPAQKAKWKNISALNWAVCNAAEGTLLHALKWTPELLGLAHVNIAMEDGQHIITELILERAGSRIKSLSERGHLASLRRSCSWPREPLDLAVELGLTHTVGQLISLYGVYYVHDPDWRWDLLDDACRFGHPEIVRRLLDDVIELDDRGYRDFKEIMYTALYHPLHLDQSSKEQRGQRIFKAVECLLERLPGLAYDKHFLFTVARQGWEELVDLFLRHGAQIDRWNREDMQRLLYEAIEGDNPSLVARMLDLGADVGPRCLHTCEENWQRFRTAMQVVTAGYFLFNGFSKLHKPNSVQIARLLVARGASLSVDQTDVKAASIDRTWSTQTPLGLAIELENYPLVEYYLELGAHHLPGELHSLYYPYSAEMAKFLMDYGFDINQPGPDGDLPMARIAQKCWNSQNLVEFYAKHVRDINAVDAKGRSALFSCCSQRSEFGVEKESILLRIKFLLEQGASLSIRDREGRTALHEAAKYGEMMTCKLLRDNGMNPKAKDHRGFTPLHEVMDSQSPHSMDHYRELKITAWLLFQGEADPDVQSDNGTYAMHVPPKLANNPLVVNTLVKMYSMHAEQRSGGDRLYTYNNALYDIYSTFGNTGGFHLRNADFDSTDATRAFINRCDRWGKFALVEMAGWFPNLPRGHRFRRGNLLIDRMLDMGADPNKADIHGVKPLRSAVLHDPVYFEKFLELDGDVNAVDESGRTILDILYERLETRPHNIFWKQKRMEQCIKMVEGVGGLRSRGPAASIESVESDLSSFYF